LARGDVLSLPLVKKKMKLGDIGLEIPDVDFYKGVVDSIYYGVIALERGKLGYAAISQFAAGVMG